jgi:hypothetical protein
VVKRKIILKVGVNLNQNGGLVVSKLQQLEALIKSRRRVLSKGGASDAPREEDEFGCDSTALRGLKGQ